MATYLLIVVLMILGIVGLIVYVHETRENRRRLADLSKHVESLGTTISQLQEAQGKRLPNWAIEGIDNHNAILNRVSWQFQSALMQFDLLASDFKACEYFINRSIETSHNIREGEPGEVISNWPKNVRDAAVYHDGPGSQVVGR